MAKLYSTKERKIMNDQSERDLVLLLQEENLDALGELYNRYKNMVFRTALAITGDPEAASDLLQDVFLRLYRYAERINIERPIEPWLYRMTANLSYNWVKRQKRFIIPWESISEWFGTRSKNPSEIIEKKDNWKQVQTALMKLSLRHRVVIVLYYLDDLSIKEIAEVLEVPQGTVKSRLYKGRIVLRNEIGLSEIENAKRFTELEYKGTT